MPLTREQFPDNFREAYAVIEAEMLAAPEEPASLSEAAAAAAAVRILELAVQLWRLD
jgi:hypothetical protein